MVGHRLPRAGAREFFGRGGNYWYQFECLRIEGFLAFSPRIRKSMT
jgi:hypothetical protein